MCHVSRILFLVGKKKPVQGVSSKTEQGYKMVLRIGYSFMENDTGISGVAMMGGGGGGLGGRGEGRGARGEG